MIGGKILSGRTKDQNIAYIAEYLTAVGINLTLNALRHRYTYVFTTGAPRSSRPGRLHPFVQDGERTRIGVDLHTERHRHSVGGDVTVDRPNQHRL